MGEQSWAQIAVIAKKRWRLCEGEDHHPDYILGPIFEDGQEVMPVSEHEADMDRRSRVDHAEAGRLHAELELLKKTGSPGVMHEIDQAFYDLTVKERDFERRKVDRLQAALEEIRDQHWVENVLDPQWSARIAKAALDA